MKTRSKNINRLLSLALCLCMVLAMLPAIPLAAEAAAPSVLYLKPSGDWCSDNARFAAYFFQDGKPDAWCSATAIGNGIYQVSVPEGYTNVIFCRMNPSNSTNSWDTRWNQTKDLKILTDGNNCFTVNAGEWNGAGGTWSKLTCSELGHDFVNNVCSRCDVTYCQIEGHSDDDVCSRCGVEQIDIFFKNDWNWSDIRLYYWYADERIVPSHPGKPMGLYGTNDGYGYYRMKVPTDVAGFVIGGYKDDNSGTREQTVDITDAWYDGATYYVTGYQDDKCAIDDFPICVDFPKNHNFVGDFCTFCQNPYLTTIFFQNNWMWTDVRMHYWGSRTGTTQIEWPGVEMEYYGNDGYYDYYKLVIPADCDGIQFNGIKDDGTGARDQSPNITSGWHEGITYHMIWDSANASNSYDSFEITDKFPCAYGHDYQAVVTEPDCVNGGYTTYTCSVCGDNYTADEKAALGHTEKILPASDPTCTDTGLTEGVACSVCGETLTAQEVLPATGIHADNNKDGYCDTCNDLMAPVQLIKTSASLEGNIAVNYFMLLSEEVLADETAYMQFTVAGDEPIKVPIDPANVIDGYYVFTCEVNAKEMTDVITSQFYYGGQVALAHEYKVRVYAKHVLGSSSDEKTQTLMKAMVNYGAASQVYFGYNTGDLANTGVTTAPDYSKVNITGFDFKRGQGTENVKLYSASLILNSETTLRLFFNGNITATYQGEPLEVKYRGGLYYVDIVDIAAKYLDDDVTITINDGTADADITFSPMSYCQLVQQDTTGAFGAEMKDLACALYLYNQAANDYFDNRG